MKLQLCRTYAAKGAVVEIFSRLLKIVLPLAIVAVCLFGYVLRSHSGIFREFQAALLSVEWMLLVYLGVWCGTFIFLTFSRNDLLLIGLLLIAITVYFIGEAASWKIADAIILLAGVTLGRGARLLMQNEEGRMQKQSPPIVGDEVTSLISKPGNQSKSPYVVSYFLTGLVGLLAFSSWWHLDMAGAYHGPRWMGLWNNPNIYGMLMGAGVVLAIGLLVAECRSRGDKAHFKNFKSGIGSQKSVRVSLRRLLPVILFIAAFMMGVGLVMSYSRGAWVGAAVGLLYLAKAHGKLKWRWVLPGILVVAAAVCFFWHSTADTDAWYFKRLDLSRPSAQHRVSAWRGALQMMWDHPLGVGWNKAVGVYDKNYSPPEGGAAALTMNSYLMLGTELGLPGLLCFISYVAFCFQRNRPHLTLTLSPPAAGSGEGIAGGKISSLVTYHSSLQTACRAGALTLLVAFWFDGGLFDLPTATVFWILLELGAVQLHKGAAKQTNEVS